MNNETKYIKLFFKFTGFANVKMDNKYMCYKKCKYQS